MTDCRPAIEQLDTYDELGNHTGVKSRVDVHRDGDLHRVFHCLVTAGRLDGTAVLQLRSKKKAAFGGKLDISAAGHLAAGEEPRDGVRELHEELGLTDIPASRLHHVGVRYLVDRSGEGSLNRELVNLFFIRDDRSLIDYRPQKGEVDGVFDAHIPDMLELFSGDIDALELRGVVKGEWTTREVTLDDLTPDNAYWITLFVMAQRFLSGHRPIAI